MVGKYFTITYNGISIMIPDLTSHMTGSSKIQEGAKVTHA